MEAERRTIGQDWARWQWQQATEALQRHQVQGPRDCSCGWRLSGEVDAFGHQAAIAMAAMGLAQFQEPS